MAVILVHPYNASAGFGHNHDSDVVVIVVVTVVIARSVAGTGIDVDSYPLAAYQTLQIEQQTRHKVSSVSCRHSLLVELQHAAAAIAVVPA